MENYNTGIIRDLKNIDNIEQALKDFSEGSEALYDLLKFCYENGIETKACCKGHEGTIARPYILFSNTALNYMSNIEEVVDILDADLVYIPKTNYFDAKCSVTCFANDQESSDCFFRNLKGILQATIENKETSLPKSFEMVDQINEKISNNIFLKGTLAPSFTKNGKKDNLYNFTLLAPFTAIMVREEDSTTLEQELDALDHNRINPCCMTLNIEQLSQYSEKVVEVLSKGTNK